MIELGIARGPDPTERRSYSSLILGAVEAAARGAGSPAAAWARSAGVRDCVSVLGARHGDGHGRTAPPDARPR